MYEPTQPRDAGVAPATLPATDTPTVITSAVRPARQPRRWPPIVLYCLLAGLIPETLATTSTSVAKIIANPLSLLFIALFYGLADLVIREAIIRRPLGLVGKLLLGAAFGFVNEGVVAGTWYTVRPQGYSYIAGVDWSWAVSLTVFHTFVSVLMPIALFESIAPSVAGVSLLRRRGSIIASALFVGFAALATLAPHFREQRMLALVAALALAALALALPPARHAKQSESAYGSAPLKPAPGPWRLRLLGFTAMALYFGCIYLAPAAFAAIGRRKGSEPASPSLLAGPLANLILLGLTAWAVTLALGWARRPGWSARSQLALITGALGFCALVTALPPALPSLEPLATVPFLLVLIALDWRARRLARPRHEPVYCSGVPQRAAR